MNPKVIDWSYYKGPVPGYGDCRAVVGEYACLLPDRHVESFLGIAALPMLPDRTLENINYIRIPRNQGDGRMAGGGQTTKPDPAYEWQWPAGWVKVGLMYGPDGVIYGPTDVVTPIVSREQYQDTGGWRYVSASGVLVDCKSTRSDVSRGLHEFTEWPDVAIGQGSKPDMGAVVLFPGETLRRLDPRPEGQRPYPFNARFMRSDRRGDLFGIAIVDLGGRHTYFVWATLAELRALPFITDPVEPPVTDIDYDLKPQMEAERAKYPTPLTEDQPAKITNAVAWNENLRLGRQVWGLSAKPNGNHVMSPQGVFVAYDILEVKDGRRLFDCFTGTLAQPLLGTVVWVESEYHNDPQGRPWVAPVAPDGGPGPEPEPDTHRYQGGGNDTGTCDQCGQPRQNTIHHVPEGKVPHAPWLGEDGVGDCDLCFQPVNAPIHSGTPPTSDCEARVRELETAIDQAMAILGRAR